MDPTVFISYASEDAAAAQRISDALRTAGVAVWFDQSELRGGDAWDQSIRGRIRDCALFIPLISANSEHRKEGYFRREWRIAGDRTQDMSDRAAFLLPVVIDATTEKGADVPDSFLRVQWTRIPSGDASTAFCERVKALLTGEEASAPHEPGASHQPAMHPLSPARAGARSHPGPIRPWMILAALGIVGAVAIRWQELRWEASDQANSTATPVPGAATAPSAANTVSTFAPPPHSIAVLPFVNMSGDKDQEYFSEGLTEELLNSLARMNELQVAARTSSFSFQGEHPDITTVAHKLNVGSILEGSVRRSGRTVRITAQLVNGVTGFHLWSQSYDRDLKDVLKLQTEIANAVASALKVTLLSDITAKIELGGTRDPAAHDSFLRASKIYSGAQTEEGFQKAIAEYGRAILRDRNYAQAYADRSQALTDYARNWATGSDVGDYSTRAQVDARRAIELAPNLAAGHLALGAALAGILEFAPASQEYARALALAPGDARVLRRYGQFAVSIGQTEAGLSAARKAVALDPLNPAAITDFGYTLLTARRYGEAIAVMREFVSHAPNDGSANSVLAYSYYYSGDARSALAPCEKSDELNRGLCLAFIYWKLGRHAEADSALADYRKRFGDDGSVFYAMAYAERGDNARALDFLETALRLRNPYLTFVKTEFPTLRNEPRFQAIEKALKFPD